MRAARYGYIKDLPWEFYHDPLVKDIYGNTVAMYAAYSGTILDLPMEFQHSSLIANSSKFNTTDLSVMARDK